MTGSRAWPGAAARPALPYRHGTSDVDLDACSTWELQVAMAEHSNRHVRRICREELRRRRRAAAEENPT